MIAIEARKYEGGHIWINPLNKKVSPNAIGLFLTESSDAAKRAWFYCRQVLNLCMYYQIIKKKYNCRVCHANMMDMKEIRKCQCKNLAIVRYEHFNNDEKDLKKKL